ncbi:hypothetical protein Tco_0536364 [Tanacetum coccineum]
MKSHITPNQKRQLPGQSPEEGMGASTLEARYQSPASSEDSSKTDLLHLGSGRGRRKVCSIDWKEKNQARIHALIVTTRVPKQGEPRYRKESIIMRAHRPEEPADIRRAKKAKGVTGSPNQKGIGKIIASKQNTLRIQWRYITSSKGMESPRRISWRDTKKKSWTRRAAVMHKSPFMHGITHPELIKRLYEKIPRSMDEMYRVTTSFLQGEVAAFSHGRKKAPTPWKQHITRETNQFSKGFKNKPQVGPEAILTPYKDPERNFRFRKRKIQGSTTNVPSGKRDQTNTANSMLIRATVQTNACS